MLELRGSGDVAAVNGAPEGGGGRQGTEPILRWPPDSPLGHELMLLLEHRLPPIWLSGDLVCAYLNQCESNFAECPLALGDARSGA